MKKTIVQLIFTLLVAFVGLFGYLKLSSFFMPFEYKIKDMMFNARGEIKGSNHILIIDIDEKSLKELGQWPWSRNKVAYLLQNLSDAGVSIIGLDVVFAEADNSSPKNVLQKLGLPYEEMMDYDALLAETVGTTPTILGYVFALTDDTVFPEGQPKTSAIIVEHNKPNDSFLIKPYRPILNIPRIQNNAFSNGYFNSIPDSDGIVRSIPLLMDYNGIAYPSLSLEMMRIVLGESKITVQYDDNGISHVLLGNVSIPTDFHGRMMVNYRGAQKSYRYISATDVYNKRIDPLELNNKIVLLGTSAAGLLDLRSTPFDSVYPGVEVHANALDNILNQEFLSKPIWAIGVDMLSIALISMLGFMALLFSSALTSFAALIFLNSLLLSGHYYFMFFEGILLNTLMPLLSLNILFLFGQGANYFLEIKQKEIIKGKFARKVSPAVMNDILSTKGDIFEGMEKEITIFFSDIRDFTTISETLNNPKHLIHLMNTYMNPMTEIIVKEGGTVDKFIGDAIMAYWNAPLNVPLHADKAVCAALNQLHYLTKLNAQLAKDPEFHALVNMAKSKGTPLISIGIGINTGMAIVGEMGSSGRSDYTVIGDAINLGSRLESLCKYYHSPPHCLSFYKATLTW